MSNSEARATLGRIDYESSFRFTRLFACFRMAVHPSRLLLGLLLIVVLYIGGRVMDLAWGAPVVPLEFQRYVELPTEEFEQWRARVSEALSEEERGGVFHTGLHLAIGLFDTMVAAALSLNIGLDQLTPGAPPADDSVVGALRHLLLLPGWLWQTHTGFLIVFAALWLLLWSLLGGTISRHIMADASRERLIPPTEAFGFVWGRWGWYLLAPILPLVIVGLFALLLAVGGLILFNVPVLNILGGLLFVLALAAGVVMALFLVGWAAGVHMMYPALSAEGTDAFDAVSRAFSYVLARPWRLLLYSFIALVYGAASYLFVVVLVFLIVAVTQWSAGVWVFAEAAEGVSRFDAMLPPPEFGRLAAMPELGDQPWHAKIAGTLVRLWTYLLIGLIGAYVISFYLSAYSVIYLLLRRYTDGTDFGEIADLDPEAPPVPDEKVEPTDEPAGQPEGEAEAQPTGEREPEAREPEPEERRRD